jgi:hypothetical protein
MCFSDVSGNTMLRPTCVFRPFGDTTQGASSMPSAVLVDLEIGRYQNAWCYFPHWQLYPGSFFVTAKAVEDYGAVSTNNSNYAVYGGYYQQISNTLTLAAPPVLSPASLTETADPPLYSPSSTVNTYLKTYALTTSFSSGSTQPIAYIDFQKGGITPDVRLCQKTFFIQCRVYTRLIKVMVVQYLANTVSTTALVIDSNYVFDTYLPKHQESGSNTDYAVVVRVAANSANSVFTHSGTLSRNSAALVPTSVDMWVVHEPTTGTNHSQRPNNLIISFTLTNPNDTF